MGKHRNSSPKSRSSKKQPRLNDDCAGGSRQNPSPILTSTPQATATNNGSTPEPRVDLDTYYKMRGLSLSRALRLNRSYVGHEGPVTAKACRGLVYLDLYVPPEGYTEADVPNIEDLPYSQPLEDDNVSPAIRIAAMYKMKEKPVVRDKDYDSDEEFQKLYNRITHRSPDKENSPQVVKQESMKLDTATDSELKMEEMSLSFNTSTSSFPDWGDLNDSALVRCTEAAEEAEQNLQEQNKKNKETDNDFSIINIVTENNTGIRNQTINDITIGSIPLNPTVSNICVDTPKSAKGISRRDARRGQVMKSSRRSSSSTSSSLNTVEKMTVPVGSESKSISQSSSYRKQGNHHVSRTLLWNDNDVAPAPPAQVTNKIGDFESDDDDEIFSQIPIPDDIVENVVNYTTNGANYKPDMRM
ncbi:hypothetical protein Fcan01_05977 [Folsomia candida]|uniref:Uncharacterized protein n=1 Tax=Folsomia candida TaxID=158441 RepID=A0A226ERM8_FOLCA|nr:hypothetical protein Fcan01_05977 [Folsomia candida]